MFETAELTNERIQTFETIAETHHLEVGNELGIKIIMVMSALVGVWGITCLVSGLASSNSLQDLGRGLFTAITGM